MADPGSISMIPEDVQRLWAEYLSAEQVRIREQTIEAMNRLIDSILKCPAEIWHPWARGLVERVVDGGEEIPVRLPLFRSILFPALLSGMQASLPGSARWMASFAQLLYKSPDCEAQLASDQRTECGLLLRAAADDPGDSRAKRRLLGLTRSRFEYVLHELPWGVLFGNNGASIEQCDALLVELSDYELRATEFGMDEVDRDLIEEARFHIPAFRQYLSESGRWANYEQYLSEH